MKKMVTVEIPRFYKNGGQHKEQIARYTLTGTLCKADNLPANIGTDCLQYSIKSARATICRGTDIDLHLASDKATEFVYISNDYMMYIMDRQEYRAFVQEFATVDKESARNGGHIKLRLKHESARLIEWLEQAVEG